MKNLAGIALPPKLNALSDMARCIDVLAQDPQVMEIWIFGSCARGTPRLDSDVDLLVVREAEPKLSSRMGLDAARQISRLKLSIPIEAVVVTQEILRERMRTPFGIYCDLADNGKKVYERAA